MSDGTYIEALAAKLKAPEVKTLGGRDYALLPPGWSKHERTPPSGHVLKVGTLTGLVDYVLAEPLDRSIIHVESPSTVSVRGPNEGEDTDFRRRSYLVATTELIQTAPFKFGTFLDYETFFIGLQTCFAPEPPAAEGAPSVADPRDALVTFVATIRENKVTEIVDDKVSQRVSTQHGVSFKEAAEFPNPVKLRPWRTFHEIVQPASLFIVRAQPAKDAAATKPTVALYEADGSRWKLDAILAIAEYLKGKLPAAKIIA